MNNVPTTQQETVTFNVFLPLFILSLAFGVILVWTLVISSYEYAATNRQRDQLIAAQVQAGGVEQKVKSLMEGLLNLAETDPEAKAIAEKYQIRFNPPSGGMQPLSPAKPGAPASPSEVPAVKRPPAPAVTSAVTQAKAPTESAGDLTK
jgi:hypothetical protein